MATQAARAEARRGQIIDVAARLIHLRGYHHTSVEDILEATGIGKGNFYYYFDSKEALGFAVLDRHRARVTEEVLEKAFQANLDPLKQVHLFLDLLLDRLRREGCRGGCPVGNLAQELSDTHERFRRRLAQVFEGWRLFVEQALRRARQRGHLRPEADPACLSRFLLAGVEGAILLAKVQKDSRVLADCFNELKVHLAAWARRQPAPAAAGYPRDRHMRRRRAS